MLAKVPQEASRNGLFAKSAFEIDLGNDRVSCPAGYVSTTFSKTPEGAKTFTFGAACAACALRSQCSTSKTGRSVSLHPQEARLQAARAYQKTPEGRTRLRKRVVVEHRLARLGQLGIGQARYFGRVKTRLQLSIACALANLRWVWNQEACQQAISHTDPTPQGASQRSFAALGGPLLAYFGFLLSLVLSLVSRVSARRYDSLTLSSAA